MILISLIWKNTNLTQDLNGFLIFAFAGQILAMLMVSLPRSPTKTYPFDTGSADILTREYI